MCVSGASTSNVRPQTTRPISGVTVHHKCDTHTRKCVRGHWSWDTEFQGTWNDPNSGHEAHFVAYLYSH